jgi:hypothetical protein
MATRKTKPRSKPAAKGRARKPEPPARRGRPSKFTPEVRKRVLDAARAGNYLETCAAFALISYDTLNEWLKRGEKLSTGLPGDEDERDAALAGLSEIEREYLDFSEAVKSERAKAEMQALMEIRQAASGRAGRRVRTAEGEIVEIKEQPGVWQAHAWFLERSFPHRWGRRVQTQEISGPGGKPIQVEDTTAPVTDSDRLARLRRLMGAEATG